jgi:hypothetical protein
MFRSKDQERQRLDRTFIASGADLARDFIAVEAGGVMMVRW